MKLNAILKLILGFATYVDCQCRVKQHHMTSGFGQVHAPDDTNAPGPCSWDFSLSGRPKLLILNVTRIQLFYWDWEWASWKNKKVCSQSLAVGTYIRGDNNACESTKPFCHIYYNNPSCERLSSLPKDVHKCENRGTRSTTVTFTSDGKYGWEATGIRTDWNYAGGFDMHYRYINCPEETTTAYLASTRVVTTTSQSTTSSHPSTTPDTTTQSLTHMPTLPVDPGASKPTTTSASTEQALITTVNSTIFDKGKLEGGRNVTVIAVALSCVLFILLLLALLVAAFVRRRNQNKNSGPAQENEYQEFEAGESAGAAVYSVANDNIAVGPTHQATNEPDRNTYSSITAPNQSEIATYATLNLDHVASQSTSRAQDIDRSTYSNLDHEGRLSQSQPPFGATSQSEASEYSSVSREPGARKVTVRYKVPNNPGSDQQAGQEMVDNVLYESR